MFNASLYIQHIVLLKSKFVPLQGFVSPRFVSGCVLS